ncbi:MAG: hypothetical protein JW902_02535 [Syntrophaceae bacterium]|nr:hypothetical protein [Syntrophaceae bacterium]
MSKAGDNIDAYCTKCRLLLNHIVLSEIDGVPAKVECKTCGSQHKYRKAPSQSKTGEKSRRSVLSKTRVGASSGKESVNALMLWENRNSNMSPDTVIREYRMQDKYKSKEVIQHATFGLGFVEKITSDTSMDVLFKDAVRRMAMNHH